MKYIASLICCLAALNLHAQIPPGPTVYARLDKYTCLPLDTVHFEVHPIRDKETNLYVEVYSDTFLLSRKTFPMPQTAIKGYLVAPAIPGEYWVRIYTYTSNFYVTLLSVGAPGSRPKLRHLQGPLIIDDSLKKLLAQFPDTCAINSGYLFLPNNDPSNHHETDWLEFNGVIRYNNRKHQLAKGEELVILVDKDSTYRRLLVPIDSNGEFHLTGFYFYDTAFFNFEINTLSDDKPDITVTPIEKQYPSFIPPDMYVVDTTTYVANSRMPIDTVFADSLHYMAPAYVTPRWTMRNAVLDHRYATGYFAGFSRYNYDLRDTSATKYSSSLADFLRQQLGGSPRGGVPVGPRQFPFGEYRVYIDQQELRDVKLLDDLDIHEDLAYVKIIEDMNPGIMGRMMDERPIMAIYKRKDKDCWSIPGKLKRIGVVGYAKI